MSINSIINKVPNYISDDVKDAKVGDTLAEYQDENGNISKDNFNIFVDDSVNAGVLKGLVKQGANEVFGYINSDDDDNISEEELGAYLKSNYGIEYKYAKEMDGDELIDYILDVETGETTPDELNTKLEEKNNRPKKENRGESQSMFAGIKEFFGGLKNKISDKKS